MSQARIDRLLGTAVEAMADGAIVADTRSGAVVVNASAREMLAIPADAIVDTTYLKDVVGFYPFDLAAGAADGQPIREEVRIGDRLLHSVVTPLREDGAPIGAIVILRDLGDTADVARRRAEFAQVMSHELRTPLTSIAGALDIVLSGYAGTLTDRQLRYVDMARQAATRMNQLVDQLLDLARAQAGTITIAAAHVQLDRLAREVIDRYRTAAAAKQLTIVLGASADDIAILGDPERLGQVLGNLLTNAIRFSPTGAVIDVQVFGPPLSEDAVGVSVHNNGDVIPEEDRERVFEPFSASSRRVGGTALGLSISRTIIEAHGGRIWVEVSEAGMTGTKFVFTLPVSPKSEKTTKMPILEPPRRRGLGDGACALVIDDDQRRALLLKGLLMALSDRVLVANDIEKALALARTEHPALAVVAGAMSDVLALLAILEHDPETHKTAVMVVGEAERRADLIAAGADDFLEFPIQPAAFRDACLRLVESGRREAPRVLVVDDDASIRQICREVLELGGYQVRDAGSATAALAEARRFRPDMILLDVLMPGIDGYRTAEMIRADPAIAMAPIMFLSAKGDTADKVRAFRSGAEDYMVKPFDAAELLARVAKALDRQARDFGASPTTGLPGAEAIQTEIERRLANFDSTVACYLDLDNLKAFNDYYGYAKANAVIRQTGAVIRNVVQRQGGAGDFIGHIAGDDFVFVTSAERVDDVCRGICDRFDHLIRLYYDPIDRERGYIETKDRFGIQRKFPIMSVSIAAISLTQTRTYTGLAELAAVGKRAAKAIAGSTYVRDGEILSAPPPITA